MKYIYTSSFFIICFFLFEGNWLNAQNTSFLEFGGNDSYFVNDSGNKLDVAGGDWTLEVWVYPTSVPTGGIFPVIMSRKYSFELYFRNTSGNLGIGLIALDGGGAGFDTEATITSGANNMTLNEWHHIAISSTKPGATRTTRLFIDGNAISTSTLTNFSLDNSISAINFGARFVSSASGYSRYIQNCAMDEIRYSSSARYTASFTITPATPPHTTDANTILLYHLNENGGSAVANDNDSDFNATLRGSPNTPTWRVWDLS